MDRGMQWKLLMFALPTAFHFYCFAAVTCSNVPLAPAWSYSYGGFSLCWPIRLVPNGHKNGKIFISTFNLPPAALKTTCFSFLSAITNCDIVPPVMYQGSLCVCFSSGCGSSEGPEKQSPKIHTTEQSLIRIHVYWHFQPGEGNFLSVVRRRPCSKQDIKITGW